MKILVICQYYYPEEFQINDICEELVKKGYSVKVLTGLPNYPTGIIPKEYRHGNRRSEIINGVEVIRCFEIPRKKGKIGLGLNYLSYFLSAILKGIKIKKDFDIIYVYQLSPVFMAIPGIFLKYLTGKKFFLYCCDLWPESLKIMNIKENSFIFQVVKFISSGIYRRCDCIGIQSPAFFEYFVSEHRLLKNRLIYIPQFANEELLKYDFNAHTNYNNTNFLFLGNIGLAQNLDCIVLAVERLIGINKKFKIHIVGDGSYLLELKALIREKNVEEYFVFYGRRPSYEMNQYYELADICLLTLRGDSVIGDTIPSKLQGYMAAGKPIVAAINGAANSVIQESGCGMVVSAGDYMALTAIMAYAIENKQSFMKRGEYGRTYFRKYFTKEKYINATLERLEKLAEAD